MSRRWFIPLVTIAGAVLAARATSQSLSIEKPILVVNLRKHFADLDTNPFRFVHNSPPIVRGTPASPATFRVQIRNPLDETVRFSRFSCDCGCTSGRLGANELGAGQTGTVEMSVDITGREGPLRFACHWYDDAGRAWTAEARTTVYGRTRFEPTSVRFGLVEPGTKHQRQVTYDEFAPRRDELPPPPSFSISSIHQHGVEILPLGSTTEALGDSVVRRRTTLELRIDASTRGGYQELHITPSAANGGSCRVDWAVRDYVEVEPRRVALTLTTSREEVRSQVVKVRGIDGNPVKIERASTTSDAIRARIVEGGSPEASGRELEIVVTLAESARMLTGDVVLLVSTPVPREVKIPVTALRAFNGSNHAPAK